MSDFWLNCDSCRRQNVGVTFVNGMRFCAKCYQETFGNINNFEKEAQDKISFAIEQLKKVKYLVNEYYGEYSAGVITNIIDDQIEELKKEK